MLHRMQGPVVPLPGPNGCSWLQVLSGDPGELFAIDLKGGLYS
jgi:hypothetical protein